MFLFRSVFIVAFASLVFVAHVSAIILPLTRYMLDAVPEGTEKNTDVDPNATTVPADVSTSASDVNVPVAADTTPAVEEDDNTSTANADSTDVANLATSDASNAETSDSSSTESSTSNTTSSETPQDASPSQSSGAGRIGGLSGTTVLVGSIVAAILMV